MARSTTPKTKKPKLDEMAGADDPQAPLDAAALLAASRSLLARLEADLRGRAEASPAVTRALKDQYERERKAERTAESFAGWSAALATQVAAAWLLSCVFVRTLEDRGLLRQARLAGKGAMDSQRLFFQVAPSLTERDYLLMVWKELAQHPAARGLFDAEHSLVWRMSPSAGLAKELLALWRTPTAEAPAFRFGQASTRFLGDLYQDLSEEVRKRYALLQTPDFVEAFILDRTLEPAVERFGLNDTTVIDPTCGSGHFLLGAFDRLFEHRLRTEPGVDRRVAAVKALDAVYGADINPYAVAIARFRLTLSFVEKAGYGKIADAPVLPLHVVVADSLRVNAQHAQSELWQQEAAAGAGGAWIGEAFALEDEAAAREVLFRRFAAVVGNPPYITEKDPAKREVYRKMYVSAAKQFSLAAPFCERFFQLARERGYTGQITANSFMKREFGSKLIEEYLPTVNLELIVNTSGAYIPGHGTPTVLLFGTNEAETTRDVLVVLAKRGEPSTPEDPAKGLVWNSVVAHWQEVGYDDDYLTVARIDREGLKTHPWSLGGGGTLDLKDLLEERARCTLGEFIASAGFSVITGEDNCLLLPADALTRLRVQSDHMRRLVIGEEIRDWNISPGDFAVWPNFDSGERLPLARIPEVLAYLWAYRTVLRARRAFGVPVEKKGIPWWALREVYADRMRTPLTIAFAEVATHNHFVLDRGGVVFKQTAPVIKLPDDATEDDHLALLAYLNSSTACFWMKQVAQAKASHTEERPEKFLPGMVRYQFSASSVSPIPLPHASAWPNFTKLARRAEASVQRQSAHSAPAFIEDVESGKQVDAKSFEEAHEHATRQLIAVQEDVDWAVYQAFELCSPQAGGALGDDWLLSHEARLFLERTPPADLPVAAVAAWRERAAELERSPSLLLLEGAEFKRRWDGGRGSFGHKSRTYIEEALDVARERIGGHIERTLLAPIVSTASKLLTQIDAAGRRLIDWVMTTPDAAADTRTLAADVLARDAVPFLAALRLTEPGLATFAEWEKVWDAQRAEDAGAGQAPLPPPKYDVSEWQEKRWFDLRGKLDVPKERFISYPGCESDEDSEPVYGWAGWDHLQRARALAALYMNRKDREGWPKERLVPMLAGILELIPWIKQWHNEPSAEFDGLRMGDYFAQFLDSELRVHSVTAADLRAWRPTRKSRGKAAKSAAAEPDVSAETPAKLRRPRKKKAAGAEPTGEDV